MKVVKYLIAVLCCCTTFAQLTRAATHYVDLSSPSPTPPYTSWATAATNIQDAVDAAVSGETVMVTNGNYVLKSEIAVTNDITIESVNGQDVTIVDGNSNARCFNLGNNLCVLSGLTIANGLAPDGEDGGGIYCSGTNPVATNCTISGNEASNGGGMAGGTATDCIISHNYGINNGGGMLDGIANNCTISYNDGYWGGGMLYGTANNCIISYNGARSGGGIAAGIANNCLIISNSAFSDGGVAGTANNCLIIDNRANYIGGMVGTANNCTIIGNTSDPITPAEDYAGGMSGTANNCIIWSNQSTSASQNLSSTTATNSCSPDLTHGVDGNITNAPAFLDPASGNYRLFATSPCIDTGTNDLVSGTTDLDGYPRIIDGDVDGVATVDMGAYELQVVEISSSTMAGSSINHKSKGRSVLRVLTTDTFDVATIDPSTVQFAGAPVVHASLNDGNGGTNLVLQFMTADLQIDPGDTEAMLVGQTYDGTLFFCMCPIKVVPK